MNIEELIVRHISWIRKCAGRYCANTCDADDLASETIYKCLSNARKFDSEKSFKPWALTIMENTYKTQYNRQKCVQFCRYDCNDKYPTGERSDQRATVSMIISVIRDCNRKSCCIGCVIMFAKGYSNDEIASRLGIPSGTVRRRISTGRKMLRDALDDV